MNDLSAQEAINANAPDSINSKQNSKVKQLHQLAERLAKLPEDKKTTFRDALESKRIDPWKLPIVSSEIPNAEATLSFAQQRLWFVEQMENDNALYNLVFGLRFDGDLNFTSVEKSIQEICKRHAVLRTTYHNNEKGEAYQQIQPFEPFPLVVESLIDHSNQETALNEWVHYQATKPFDLKFDRLFRFTLFEMSRNETVGVFVVHHIAFDYLSVELMVREFSVLYTHFCNTENINDTQNLLPQLPIQYSDFAHWQQQWAKSKSYQQQKDYWVTQLKDAPPQLELATDFIRSQQRRCLGKRAGVHLSVELSDQLRALAQRQNVTLYMVLMSVFNVLLHKYSQQNDICVGTSIANRGRAEVENLLGFFVNLLVMRNSINATQSFSDVLADVNTTATNAYSHQDIPFDHLVDVLKVPRNTASTPLFQVLFVLTQGHEDTSHSLPNLTVSTFHHDQGIARYELTLRINDMGAGTELLCQFEYDSDLYTNDTINHLLRYYQQIAQTIVKHPNSQLCDIKLTADASKNTCTSDLPLGEFNDVAGIHRIVEQFANSQPDNIAVVYEQEQLSYAELNAKANQLARYLRSQGVTNESRVALFLERSHSLIIAILAILKAGAAYVPFDTKWPTERINTLLVDTGIECLLSERCWSNALKTVNTQTTVFLDDDHEQWRNESTHNLVFNQTTNTAAYVIYTSGSTGKAKGVVVEHQHIINYTLAIINRLETTTDNLNSMSFAHISTIAADLGNTILFGALCSGGCLHLISNDRAFDADSVAQYMSRHEIDVLKIVPSHLQGLLSASNSSHLLPKKILIVGGETCSADLFNNIRALSPQLRIINHYGPTETTVGVLTHEIPIHETIQHYQRIPLGKPLANNKAWVFDEHLRPCPIGAVGELFIGGAGVARGYLHQPKLTEAKFIQNPLISEREKYPRLYRTGDRVRCLNNGDFEFLGRADNQVKIRGYRVELGDIEVSLKRLDAVSEAVAIICPSELSSQLVAFVVLDNTVGSTVDPTATTSDGITNALTAILPEYMIPQVIIVLDAIPLNANGKIDTPSLNALVDKNTQAQTSTSLRLPQSGMEKALADIWCQVLKIDNIGIDDDFFQLGGDSILSLQVIARAKRAGMKLSPKQLFEQPTIGKLAALMDPANTELMEHSNVESAQQSSNNQVSKPVNQHELPWRIHPDSIPLTPIQRWFFEANHPDKHHWNQSKIFQVKQSLVFSSLVAAVTALIDHHDALRLSFNDNNGVWQQKYLELANIDTSAICQKITPEELNLVGNSSKQAISSAIEAKACALQKSLNLEHGPLIKLAYFSLSELKNGQPEPENDRLLIIIHHLAVDGVSWRILLNDLHKLYSQHISGQTLSLGAKTNSYQQWAEQLVSYASSPYLSKELNYWKSLTQTETQNKKFSHQVSDIATNDLSNQMHTQASVTVSLSSEQTAALIRDVPAIYNTQINDVLLAALTQVLCDENRSTIIELEGHGRESLSLENQKPESQTLESQELDLSQTVGWFTSRFPVRLHKQDSHWSSVINSTKDRLRDIPNKGIGYGLLRYMHPESAVTDNFSDHSNPQLCFNYLGQFDNLIKDTTTQVFSSARENTGDNRAPTSQRHNPLELISRISDQKLTMTWQYSRALHSKDWVQTLAESYRQSVLDLIKHCLSEGKRMSNHHSNRDSSLQSLRPASGEKISTPLYCLHHRGGHTLEYKALAEHLDESIAVYGIQSNILSDPNYREDDITVVAKQYADVIQTNQPKGPYRLLGWSLGGVLSMAIAQELERRGELLDFIGLIDSFLPTTGSKNRYETDTLLDNVFAIFGDEAKQRYASVDVNCRQELEKHLSELDENRALEFACDWIIRFKLVDESVIDRSYLSLKYRAAAQSQRLIHSYQPTKIKATLHLWWAQQSLDNQQGATPWKNYCTSVANDIILQTTHTEIIQNADLLESLAQCITADSTPEISV